MVYAGTAFVRMVGDFSHLNRQLAGQLGPMEKASSRAGRAIGGALKVGLGAAAVGGFEAVRAFTEFNRSMTLVSTQAGAGAREVRKLEKSVVQMSTRSRFSANSLAQSLYYIESHGFRQFGKGAHQGTKALQLLDAAQKFAAVGGVADLGEATRALTGAMKSNIKGTETAGKTIKTLHAIIGQGSLKMQDLIAALGTNFVVAGERAGLTLRDVGAALDVATRQGATAQLAATRLRYAFTLLVAPTDKAKNQFKHIGLGAYQLARDMRKPQGLVRALQDLHDHLDKLPGGAGGIKATAVLSGAFGGARSYATISQLVNKVGEVRDVYDKAGRQANRFNSSLRQTERTPSFKFHEAWNRINALFIDLGSKITPKLADELQKITGILIDPKLTTQEKFSKIGDEIAKGFQKAAPALIAFAAQVGPKVAEAFVKAFINAGPWTRLIVGGFLIHKFIGWGNIFRGAASRVGGEVGTGMGAAMTRALRLQLEAMEAMTAEIVTAIRAQMIGAMALPAGVPVKGRAFSRTGYGSGSFVGYTRGTGTGTGGAMGRAGAVSYAGAFTKGLETEGKKPGFLSKLKGFGGGIGATLGIAAAITFGPDLVKHTIHGLKDTTGGVLGGLPKPHTFLGSQGLGKGFDQAFGKGGLLTGSPSVQLHLGNLFKFNDSSIIHIGPQISKAEKQLKQLGGTANSTFKTLIKNRDFIGLDQLHKKLDSASVSARRMGKTDWADSFARASAKVQNAADAMAGSFSTLKVRHAKSFDSILSATANVEFEIGNRMPTKSQEGASRLVGLYQAAASQINKIAGPGGKMPGYVRRGLAQINKELVKALVQLGLTPEAARSFAGVGPVSKEGSDVESRKRARGGIIKAARGYFVGSPGEAGSDNVNMNLPLSSIVLNRYQQAALGLAKGGTVPVTLGRGELVMPPESRADLERLAASSGYGGLGDLFRRVNRPHYMAKGGMLAGLRPGMAKFAQMFTKRFPLSITSTTGGNHVPGSYHYKGEAVDFSAAQDIMLRAAQWLRPRHAALTEGIHNPNLAVKDGKLYGGAGPFGSVWAGHRNHIHVAIAGALRGLAGLGVPHLRRIGIRAPGAIAAAGNAALDTYRRGAHRKLARAAARQGGGDKGSFPALKGQYGKGALKRLWIAAGGPRGLANIAAAIALAESGGNPNIDNPNSPAKGLWQILGQLVPGNIHNPRINALNAVQKWITAPHGGHNFSPWVTYTDGSYRQYLARGTAAVQGQAASGGPSSCGPGMHWVKGHRAKNPGGNGYHYVHGHCAHDPGTLHHRHGTHHGRQHTAPRGFPKHSPKHKKIKYPKIPRVKSVDVPKLAEGFKEWPSFAYSYVKDLMGNSPRSIAAAMEREDIASQIFDRTEETFIRTEDDQGNPLPQPIIDVDPAGFFPDVHSPFPVNRRIGELYDLIGKETGIQGLVTRAADMLPTLKKLAAKAIEHFRNQIKAIHQRIRDNIKRIKALHRQINHEKSKAGKKAGKPDLKKINTWQHELVKLEGENLFLTGNKDGSGDGGDLKKQISFRDAFKDASSNIGDWTDSLVGISGAGGTRFDVSSTMFDLQKQLADLSPEALAKALKQAGSATDNSNLADLLQQQSDRFEHAYKVSQAQYAVFGGLGDLFGGSFKYGGTVPGPLGAARMILAHGGERVTPPDVANDVNVHIHPRGGLAELIDVRVERATRRQTNRAGRRLPGRGGGAI